MALPCPQAKAREQGAPFFGYINGDIMLTEDLLVTLRLVKQVGPPSSLLHEDSSPPDGS